MNREHSRQMMHDDLFFAPIFVFLTGYALFHMPHWWGYFLVTPFFLLSLLWLGARLYHLTHPEVFED